MQIFKFIKNKIKLFKKTKEEKFQLVIEGKNTPIEATSMGSGVLVPLLSFSALTATPVVLIALSALYTLGFQITPNYQLATFLGVFTIFNFHFLRLYASDPFYYNLCIDELIENMDATFLIQHHKQINRYLTKNNKIHILHEYLNRKLQCDNNCYLYLIHDTENARSFFDFLKRRECVIFDYFFKTREILIDKNETDKLNQLDKMYNDFFLIKDLEFYIKENINNQDENIYNYLKTYGCKKHIFNHFETKNQTVTTLEIEQKEEENKKTIDFNLLNQKRHMYANF